MKLYNALLMVKQAADPLRTTNSITEENRDEAVRELEALMTAVKLATDTGATRHDVVCAVAGTVSDYLKGS